MDVQGGDVSPAYLGVKELAVYVGISPSWIYKKVALKAIPFRRAGRLVKFRRDEIDRWLAERGDGV